MTGIQPLLTGIIISILFAFAIFQFTINYQSENIVIAIGENITQNDQFVTVFTNIQNNLTDATTTINEQAQAYYDDEPDSSLLFLIMNTIVTIPKTLISLAGIMFNSILSFIFPQLFGPTFQIVMSIMVAILTIYLVIAAMKFVRSGVEK